MVRKYLSGWWLTYPSEKYEFVSWDDEIPNIWEHKTCSKPPTKYHWLTIDWPGLMLIQLLAERPWHFNLDQSRGTVRSKTEAQLDADSKHDLKNSEDSHLEKHEKSMAKSMPWKEQPKEPASFGCSQWWVLIQHSIGQFVQKAPQHNDGQVTSLKLACGHPTLKLGICKNDGILVGGWPTPLKNMSSSVGMMKFPIYGKIKARFQTTNQH